MTAWRLPERDERELDRRYLAHFLTAAIAARIAELPVIVLESAPLRLRAEAWLWRTSQLMRSSS